MLTMSINSKTFTQTCGFGCLGLSGIYGGYSFENYHAEGLNHQLNKELENMGVNDQRYDFRTGMGFRFGMNIVRANFDDYFFTVKGYYQFLEESQTVTALLLPGEEFDFKSKFEMNHWALGFDFGIPVFNFMDWKIVDGSLKFFNTKLTQQDIYENKVVQEKTFNIPKITMGYAVGSGLIIHIIKDFVSIEGTGMYNFTKIENLTNDNNTEHLPNDDSEFPLVTKGGLSAVVQLNIGIPL